MDNYNILGKIGEGAHGVVYKAKDLTTGVTIAMKKVALRRPEDGIPNNALREMKALQEIGEQHNIVRLLDVFSYSSGFVLVFEYMLSDLSAVIRNFELRLTEAQVKTYMVMLLNGIKYCHDNRILHRDLKPANLLISYGGHLKLADFGLSRVFDNCEVRPYSHQVATRWYRAPELLYGARRYDSGVDMWAVGCIFGELCNSSPLFPGENDIEQLCCVFRILGTPNSAVWPAMESLPDYNKLTFPEFPSIPLEEVVTDACSESLDLLKRLLVYSAPDRMSAGEALLHPYFFSEPLPAHHSELPIPNRQEQVRARGVGEEFDVCEPLEDSLEPMERMDPFPCPSSPEVAASTCEEDSCDSTGCQPVE